MCAVFARQRQATILSLANSCGRLPSALVLGGGASVGATRKIRILVTRVRGLALCLLWLTVFSQLLNLRRTTKLKCAAVPRRARVEGAYTSASLHSRRESNKEEEEVDMLGLWYKFINVGAKRDPANQIGETFRVQGLGCRVQG